MAVFCDNVTRWYFAIEVAIHPTALLFCDVCQLQNSKTYKTSQRSTYKDIARVHQRCRWNVHIKENSEYPKRYLHKTSIITGGLNCFVIDVCFVDFTELYVCWILKEICRQKIRIKNSHKYQT